MSLGRFDIPSAGATGLSMVLAAIPEPSAYVFGTGHIALGLIAFLRIYAHAI